MVNLPDAVRRWWPIAAAIASYYLAAHAGLAVHRETNVAPFWPASGILVGALVLIRLQDWRYLVSGVWLFDVIAHLQVGVSVLPAVTCASTTAFACVAGVYIARRLCGSRSTFTRARDLSVLMLSAGVAMPAAFALVLPLVIPNPEVSWLQQWFTGWLVGCASVFVIAPFVIYVLPSLRGTGGLVPGRLGETVALAIFMLGSFLFVFFLGARLTSFYALLYLTMPALVWASARFGLIGAATANVCLGVFAVSATLQGSGAFALSSLTHPEQLLWTYSFLVISAVASLMLAALAQERDDTIANLDARNRQVELARKSAGVGFWQLTFATGEVAYTLADEPAQRDGDVRSTQIGRLRQLVHPEDLLRVDHAVAALKNDFSVPFEEELRLRGQAVYGWVSVRGSVVVDAEGEAVGAVGCYLDITDRREAEIQLQEYQAKLESALTLADIGIWEAQVDRSSDRLATRLSRIFGPVLEHPPETTEAFLRDLVLAEDRSSVRRYFERVAAGDAVDRIEFRVSSAKGIRWITGLGTAIDDPVTNNRKLVGVAQDVTRTKQHEQELRSNRNELRRLSTQLLLKEEDYRRQVAIALHDRIGQNLAILKMRLDMLAKHLDAPAAQSLREHSQFLQEIINAGRELTAGFASTYNDFRGIRCSLEELVETLQEETDADIVLEVTEGLPEPGGAHGAIVYRCIRECLVNVLKHAQASRVAVQAAGECGGLSISIQDDGNGFDDAVLTNHPTERGQFGLVSVRESVLALGGKFALDTSPGQGCRVTIQVPSDLRSNRI